MNLPFPLEEYHERIRRLQELMADEGLDCLVVLGNRADGSNIRYLTNFEDFYGGDSIAVIPEAGPPGFTTNAVMHSEPMHSGIQDCWIEDVRLRRRPAHRRRRERPGNLLDHVEDFTRERGVGSGVIGLVSVGTGELVEFLQRVFPASRVTSTQILTRAPGGGRSWGGPPCRRPSARRYLDEAARGSLDCLFVAAAGHPHHRDLRPPAWTSAR